MVSTSWSLRKYSSGLWVFVGMVKFCKIVVSMSWSSRKNSDGLGFLRGEQNLAKLWLACVGVRDDG